APVSAVGRACATFGTSQTPAASLDVASTTLQGDQGSADGDNAATVVPGAEVPGLTVRRPGTWATATTSAARSTSVAIRASGGLAPLSDAFAVTRPAGDLGGGLAVQQCPEATASSWFVGAGSTTSHPSTLVLTNPSDIESVVDIGMYGADGSISVVGGSSIVIDPGTTRRIPLERLATGEDDVAMSVLTSRGTVSASVLDATGDLSSYTGSDYLPAASPPSTDALITGVPADSDDGREMLVANPSDSAANVSVSVVGKDGSFTPSDLQDVSVAAGSVKTVELPEKVGSGALSVRLTSNVPVTGTVRATTTGGDGDVSYAVAQDDFQGPVPVPFTIGDALDGTTVDVAAVSGSPEADGSLRVRAHTADGTTVGEEATVDLPAGTTVSFDPLDETGAPAGQVAYVTVEPDDAGARAAVTYRDGDSWSTNPLSDLPETVDRPAVVPGGGL
ncbi:MAG: DUF5719 family protein, partial [Nocardioidaceae bacterium]